MKKLITIILALALIVPAISLAADGDSPFFGKWAGLEHHAIMHYGAILHYVEIDKNSPSEYFVFNLITGGGLGRAKIDSSEMYSSKWKVVDDHIRVKTSEITYVDFFYDEESDTIYTKNPKVTYMRLP